MVKYEHIIQTIKDYVEKCSNKETQNKLNEMPQQEKEEKLKTLTNPAEFEHYRRIQKRIKECERLIKEIEEMDEEHKKWWGEEWVESNINLYNEQIKEAQKELFNYERRILQGYTPKETQKVEYDITNYKTDKQYKDEDINAENYQKQMGATEKSQIKEQSKIKFTDKEEESLEAYFGEGSRDLNKTLYNDGIITENQSPTFSFITNGGKTIPSMKEMNENLSTAINKTSLKQDTIVFHGGHFDLQSVVGDEVNFKGFTSCSFQKDIAHNFTDDSGFIYKIALPKGSHGLVANGKVNNHDHLTGHEEEHELLLDKGFKGKIADIDYKNHVVTIIPA